MQLKALKPDEGLKLFDINWKTQTAGPSPNNNERIEVFLLGCNKAMQGNPCKGCFNSITWDCSKAQRSWNPIELADMVNKGCDPNNKYVTIGGGEPTDQIGKLIPFIKRLKEHGFHIMMYTWRKIDVELHPYLDINYINSQPLDLVIQPYKIQHLLKYVDIIVDGEFKKEECMYQQDLGDGMLSSIGSGNQRIFDIKHYRETNELLSYKMKDLVGLYVKPDTNDLVYITKN